MKDNWSNKLISIAEKMRPWVRLNSFLINMISDL